MGEWSPSLASRDFLSLYTSMSKRSPVNRVGAAEIFRGFSPPANGHAGPDDEDGLFCNRRNVDECISYLNKEVMVLGLSSLYDARSQTFDIVRLVNNTYELLNKLQSGVRGREDLHTKLQRSECDLREAQSANEQLKTTVEQLKRENAGLQERERQAKNRNKILASNLKTERDEIKRLQSDMQHKQSQFKHEVKKKEKENQRLKERLHGVLTDKNKDKKLGMQISQLLQKSDRKRGTWGNDNKHEEEAYREVIISYEARQKQLLVENSGMRQCLKNLQKELISLLNAPDDDTQAKLVAMQTLGADTEAELSDIDEIESLIGLQTSGKNDLSEAHFQMPYDLVGDSIEKGLVEKLRIIKSLLKNPRKFEVENNKDTSTPKEGPTTPKSKTPNADTVKELEKLNKQVERYRQIVDQQERLIQESLSNQDDKPVTKILEEADLWEEKERLQRDMARLKEQQKNFETERKNFTDAAIRLSRERQELDEEKAVFLQQQFLRITPLNSKRQTPVHNKEGLTFVTPRVSPAPGRAKKSPTTAELYRTLGLVPLSERESSEGASLQFCSPDLKTDVTKVRHTPFIPPQQHHQKRVESHGEPRSVSPRRKSSSSKVSGASPPVGLRSISETPQQQQCAAIGSTPDSVASEMTASNSTASSDYVLARTGQEDSLNSGVLECHTPVEYQSDMVDSDEKT